MTTDRYAEFAALDPRARALRERAMHDRIEIEVKSLGMEIAGFPDKGGVTRLFNDYARQVLASLAALKFLSEGGTPEEYDCDIAFVDTSAFIAKVYEDAIAGIRINVDHEIAAAFGLTDGE